MTRVFFANIRRFVFVTLLCIAPYFAAQAKVCFLPECAAGGGSNSATSNFGNKNCNGYTLSTRKGEGYDCTSCTNKNGTKYKCTVKSCSEQDADRTKRLTSAINKPHFVCRVSCQSGEQKYYSCNCESGYKLVRVTEDNDGVTTINTASSRCEKICLANEEYDSAADECVCVFGTSRKYGDYGPCEKYPQNCSSEMTYDDTSNTCFDCRNYQKRSHINLQQLTAEGKSYRTCFSGSDLYCVDDEFTRFDANNTTCIKSDNSGLFSFSDGRYACDDEVNKRIVHNDHCECLASVNGAPLSSFYKDNHLYCLNTIDETVNQIVTIARNVRSYYTAKGDYRGLCSHKTCDIGNGVTFVKNAALVPSEMIDESRTIEDDDLGYSHQIFNLYDGGVVVWNDDYGQASDEISGRWADIYRYFQIIYFRLPREACISLATQNWPNLLDGLVTLEVFAYEYIDTFSEVMSCAKYGCSDNYDDSLKKSPVTSPLSRAEAEQVCNCPNGNCSIMFGFNHPDKCTFMFDNQETVMDYNTSFEGEDSDTFHILSSTAFNVSTNAPWIDADAYLEEDSNSYYEYYFAVEKNTGSLRVGTITFTQDGTDGCNKTLQLNVIQAAGNICVFTMDGSASSTVTWTPSASGEVKTFTIKSTHGSDFVPGIWNGMSNPTYYNGFTYTLKCSDGTTPASSGSSYSACPNGEMKVIVNVSANTTGSTRNSSMFFYQAGYNCSKSMTLNITQPAM